MSNIRFLPLGGQDERNKNCFIIRVNDSIFIFNCGVKIPVNVKFGVNMICPDFNELKKESHKIKGIFLGYPTHANYGGILYLLEKIGYDVPIYCSPIGKIIIETFLEKRCWNYNAKKRNLKFVISESFKPISFGQNQIVPFSIANTIPGSLGWIIRTQNGAIVYLDDFIITSDRSKMFQTQISKVEHLVGNNTLALVCAMGIVDKNKSFTVPNHKNSQFYQSVVKNAKGRVFIACTDSEANTIINLVKIARANGRPFSIYSNTFMNVFSAIVKQKLINIKGLQCLQISDINTSDNAVVIISSTQEHLFKYLINIANNQNGIINFRKDDTFVLGTQIIPGYEGYAANLLDQLSKIDLNIEIIPKTILPSYASAEDQKYLLNRLNPKYVFPIQGLYKTFVKYREFATQTWTKPEQIIFLDNGEEMVVEDGNINKKIINHKLNEICINSAGLDDSSSSVIYEREKLSEAGAISVSIFFLKEKQLFIDKINYQTFGIVTNSDSNNRVVRDIMERFKKMIPNCLTLTKKNIIDHKATKKLMKKAIMKLFERSFEKRPVVLLTIIEF